MSKARMVALLCALPACALPAVSAATTDVSVIKAEYRPVFQQKTYSTSLTAAQRITLISQTSGAIVEKMVRNGQNVSIGDVIVQLDDSDYQLNHRESEANLKLAEANYREAQNELKRASKLHKSGGMSQSRFEQVETQFIKATASKELAEVNEQRAALALERTRIRAKAAGKVINLYLDEGQHVTEGSHVCDIINDDKIDAIVELPSNDRFLQAVNTLSAHLSVDSANYSQSGQLFAIDGAIDPTKSTLRVRYRFNNEGQLLDGHFGKVTLSNNNGEGNITVPQSSVLSDRQGQYVYVANNGILEQKRVQSLGKYETSELVNGLQKDDLVVVSGTIKLYPSQEVNANLVDGGEG
ncbi:efflux RND transporter periplasmic adaptor subunit [Endozoicomonas gorgoniicola]|uniref:Efflux RND transporter periplasmic adaptor subunit n=1 Tax=Endozoicomonas gorgoniicola TaxID=1234144 RepID=A0ABT3MUQ6_9GAMM|nr:efflux RND transporter periplasmic adaptor subunit [Endozoicomonas gorgoniicola]MCW7553117.1 efflux RND transporter periplasmic adaptor subunit [Endozoicomonas gorgoniicola]